MSKPTKQDQIYDLQVKVTQLKREIDRRERQLVTLIKQVPALRGYPPNTIHGAVPIKNLPNDPVFKNNRKETGKAIDAWMATNPLFFGK